MDTDDSLAEAVRVREAYARRDASGKAQLYAWHRADVQWAQYRFRAAVTKALLTAGHSDLSRLDCLDVGCGTGAWLRTLEDWGASASRLHGVDLLPDRIERAKTISPMIDFQRVDGGKMAFPDRSMDLVTAHTVFSSILDSRLRLALAQDMLRLVRPGGLILVYDFRIRHPRSVDTVGIRYREIKRLFPGCAARRYTVTLAPPLQRPLAGASPLLAHLVESLLPFLRTHAVYSLCA